MSPFGLLFVLVVVVLGYGNCVSLQFTHLECRDWTNETEAKNLFLITEIDRNETCIQINQTNEQGEQMIFLYISLPTDQGFQFELKTDNCSASLPQLQISLCPDEQINNDNQPIYRPTPTNNDNFTDILFNQDDDNQTSTTELPIPTTINTESISTLFETTHQLDQDSSEEEQQLTTNNNN